LFLKKKLNILAFMAFYKKEYATGEVSEMLGICRSTVINYCKSGKIKCIENPLTKYRWISFAEVKRLTKKYKIKF